ncbi:SDR family NAD(P)-dependent oxidoreductase [Candidatus Thioglobus sp.]|jgi:17beta-estradiol 17-dehydrogenase / 3beta-hydroxysteroid 3-dehydrogenase|nr:SDR family NAD(P)-dependent oxidoreductase [Candidatus Thioglobus sp.]MDA8872030.1 SDR family NAD(P)-dependent oxidoreductase [Candidatus Thioglobus sp.]
MIKNALVTGGSSGIGRAIVIRLAKEGYRVITCGRQIDKLNALKEELLSQGYKIFPIETDLRSEASINQLFVKIRKDFGCLEVLINAAAVGYKAPLSSSSTNLWNEMLSVNVIALCICSREMIKDLNNKNLKGHIVNISSLSGHRIASEAGIYEATKFSVTVITESLRRELLPTKGRIKVSQISPGLTKSSFHKNYYDSGKKADSIYSQFQPLEGSNIADAVFYILSQPENVQINDILLRPVGQIS